MPGVISQYQQRCRDTDLISTGADDTLSTCSYHRGPVPFKWKKMMMMMMMMMMNQCHTVRWFAQYNLSSPSELLYHRVFKCRLFRTCHSGYAFTSTYTPLSCYGDLHFCHGVIHCGQRGGRSDREGNPMRHTTGNIIPRKWCCVQARAMIDYKLVYLQYAVQWKQLISMHCWTGKCRVCCGGGTWFLKGVHWAEVHCWVKFGHNLKLFKFK